MIITIDGPAASGKGTIARRVAAHFGYRHLDTGRLYRATGRDVLAAGGDPDDPAAAAAAARALDPRTLCDPALSSAVMGDTASRVSRFREVRDALLDFQRAFARQPPGAVLDGRDAGTVVCPDADVKLFVTADVEVRARRRCLELRDAGEPASFDAVLADILARDERDKSRNIAPLRPARDARLLDTTKLDIEAAFRAAVDLINAAADRVTCAS